MQAMNLTATFTGKPTILTCRPSTQARRARVSLICQAQRLVLKPTGDGDASHIDPSSPLSAASLLELKEGSIYELGRQEPADLIVPVPTVSARHALVRVEEDGSVTVTDLGSTNGTIIDGQELKPNASAKLFVGGNVVFGDSHLASFVLAKEEEASEAA